MAMASMKGSGYGYGYGGGCKNKLFSSSQQCRKSFFVFPSTRIVANVKHDHDSDGDIIRPLSADEVLKKGFRTEAIKALTLNDISEEDLFQVDFIVGPERASNVTEVLTKLGLKFNQTDVWGGFGLQYRELRVEEIELGTPLADPGLKYFAYNHFACNVKYSAILKAFEVKRFIDTVMEASSSDDHQVADYKKFLIMSVAPISAIPLFSGNFSLFRMKCTVKPVAISELSFLRVMKQLSLAGVWASEVEGKVGIEGPRGAVDIDWLGDLSKFVNSESLLADKDFSSSKEISYIPMTLEGLVQRNKVFPVQDLFRAVGGQDLSGGRMSCTTFNVATSPSLHGLSKPLGFRNHCSFHKSSTHLLKTFNLSFVDHSFSYYNTLSHSFKSAFKCVAQSSESSASVGVETNNNSKRVAVLVIGGGGREHALCHALQRSPSCDTVFCAPGNAGIASSGNATCISDLDVYDGAAVELFCRKWRVGLVVVGPEAPLVAGLSNYLVKAGITTFGPSAEAAALEGSKNFMKHLCDKYDIPTAKYKMFTDPSAARQYIQEEGAPIVIKVDGLAAGKGVTVAMTLEEAYEAVDSMLVKGDFGSAGCRVIVEEFLEGEEVSFFALADGENAIPLGSAQDHKRVGDGDTGPNTGGMGAYSPAPILTKELQSIVMDSIIMPTVKGMSAEGCKFVGVLFAGLMIEKESGMPKLIEYNVRFGDPECQVLMVRLQSDLVQVLLAACRGELSGVSLDWSPESAMVVVMASKGYPGSYEKGTIIENLEEAELVAPDIKIFHAGTAFDSEGRFIATGGRVLGVTAKGNDLEEACDRAYQAVENVNWPGGFYRRDIGWRALPQKQHASKV